MRLHSASLIPLALLVLLTTPVTNATYTDDGSLVILRSQYLDNPSDIHVDGHLTEDAWSKAGSLTLNYTQADNAIIKVYFTNTDDRLYFGIEAPSFPANQYDEMLLSIDTDADGTLVTPEDGIHINNQSQFSDYYWTGTSWTSDQSDPETGGDFFAASSTSSGIMTVELEKRLVADNLAYDGLRIPNPTNTFIGINLRYVETQLVNDTASPIVFDFPTTPSNGSGYVDLKLAGAEDQDLPEFIPPTTFVNTNTQSAANQVLDTLGAELPLNISVILGITLIGIIVLRRRAYS